LLVPIIVYGSVSTNLSGTITGSTTGCTPAGSPCPLGGQPPSGFHFDLVYSDDFTTDTTLNTLLWINGSTADTLYFDANGLNIQPTTAVADCRSGSCAAGIGSTFSPRYGYWEWSVKYPRGWDGTGDGYHFDTYINNNVSTDRVSYQEIGIGENDLGTSNNNVADFYCCGNTTDGNSTVDVQVPINSPTRFSDAFHIVGAMWVNDGVGNGAVSSFLDGSALYTGGRQGPWWGSGGAVIIMNVVSCVTQPWLGGNPCSGSTATSGNPATYKYFRYWQLVPN
jgi:hypothetical protein